MSLVKRRASKMLSIIFAWFYFSEYI